MEYRFSVTDARRRTDILRDCVSEEVDTKSTLITGNDHSILLQTANGFIGDPKEEKLEEIKILLDLYSQQTFIKQRIAAKLQLSHVRKINMTIKAF